MDLTKELRNHYGVVEMWPRDIKPHGCSLLLCMAEVVCCAGCGTNTAGGDGPWPEGSTPLVLAHDMIPG